MRKSFVIGWPISHSRSPIIHKYWLRTNGISGDYLKIEVSPEALPAFVSGLVRSDFVGGNVTVPHKQPILKLLDHVEPAARAIGAVNTVWIDSGKRLGTNTDAAGFITHLQTMVPSWAQSDFGAVLVLGAGGAARAVIYGLLDVGVERIIVANRTIANAEELVRHFGDRVHAADWNDIARLSRDVSLLVNTTTLGMDGAPALEFDVTQLRQDCVVFDIVYVPLETRLLALARERGLRTVDGLGMLLHQAVPGFEMWFGTRPLVCSELRDLVVADLEKKRC